MNDVERMIAERDCEKLCTRFHNLIDAGAFDEVLSLFAPDAVWRHRTGERRGLEAIQAYLDEKSTFPLTRHLVTNVVITVDSADRARGVAYVTIYYAEPTGGDEPALLSPPVAVVHYEDEFVRLAQGWRFSKRAPKMVLRHPSFGDMILTKADEMTRRR